MTRGAQRPQGPPVARRDIDGVLLPLLAGLVLLLLNERRVMRGGQHGVFT